MRGREQFATLRTIDVSCARHSVVVRAAVRMIRTSVLTRRRFLRIAGTGVAAATTLRWNLGCGDNITPVPPTGRFFDSHQWATIDAATGILLPGVGTDDGTGNKSTAPGARDAMVVNYIDILCASFDLTPPGIFGSGPASGRTPAPNDDGTPSTNFPPDAFATYLPLSRVRSIAWQMRVFGSTATTGGTFNDALLGVTVGYRDAYTAGVTALDNAAAALHPGTTFVDLDSDDQAQAFDTVSSQQPVFYNYLLNHTLEGAFAAPEYGGNDKLVGWQLASYDGDSVPLGHSHYDAATDAYVDRVDQPTSTPTPGDMAVEFTDDVLKLLSTAALGSGGMKFF